MTRADVDRFLLVYDLQHELTASKERIADLERRIEAANDLAERDFAAAIDHDPDRARLRFQVEALRDVISARDNQHERDTAAVIAAEHAQHEAERALKAIQDQLCVAMSDLQTARPAAYPLTDTELAWYVAQAREDQRVNGIVHPLAALAERVDRLHAGSQLAGADQCSTRRVVRWDDLEPLLTAVARTPT